MSADQEINTSRHSDLSRSVGFWVTLFVALGLYGMAVLSPKLAGREELLSESHTQRIQLLHNQQKLTRLQQVAASLQQDSRFVEELLQRDRKSQPHGDEEIIPLEGNLVYRENKPEQEASAAAAMRNPPWYAPLLRAIGHSPDIRGVLLLSSVVLILFAFGFLQLPESHGENPNSTEPQETPPQPALLKKWLSRYDRSEDDAERQKLRERLARLESDADWDKDALPIVSFDDRDS
jgi:hypothetical protein